jgi:hypothetical protein
MLRYSNYGLAATPSSSNLKDFSQKFEGKILEITVKTSIWQGGLLSGYRAYNLKARISDKPNHYYYIQRKYSDFQNLYDILAAHNLNDVIPPLPNETKDE